MSHQNNTEIKGKKSLPFFARLLEEQEVAEVSGGRTLKYPSDSDEMHIDITKNVTMKYPSDNDESGSTM